MEMLYDNEINNLKGHMIAERKQKHFIKSLAKGIKILQAFSTEKPILTLTDIAKKTGMNTTAVQRFSDTWMTLGFLKRTEHKEFYLGPKVLTLGFSYLNGSQLRGLSEIYLSEFATRINRNVNLGILEEEHVVYLFRKETQSFIKSSLGAGSIMPCYCTAMGKILLAGLNNKKLEQVLDTVEMVKATKHTITDRQLLLKDLMETRRRGYSICDRELSLALYSIAVPLLNDKGVVVAAVNLSLSADEALGVFLQNMISELVNVGKELSSYLGYEGEYPKIFELLS
jgi:IclR family transcriptional regulator, pca regulon regulatory protein